jgi:hypothetical protein
MNTNLGNRNLPSSRTALEWPLKPFQLVSLLQMYKYPATRIFSLQYISFSILNNICEEGKVIVPSNYAYNAKEVERLKERMETWVRHLDFLGLEFSSRFLKELIKDKLTIGITHKEIGSDLEVLEGRIDHEIDGIQFGFIPKDRVPYFENKHLFGEKVSHAFPSVSADLKAAGLCYAHSLYTAAVFHLMRCVESGARSLVRGLNTKAHLSRPIELSEWGEILAAIQEGLKLLRVGSRTTQYKKDKYEFYNHAAAQFMNFKDAWRNNVSHSRKEYQQGETKDIFDNAKQFMKHLSTRLKEPKKSPLQQK